MFSENFMKGTSTRIIFTFSNNLGYGDNRKDLIVKTRRGDTFELIQTKDGRYKLFNCEDEEAAKKEAKLNAYLENNIPFSSEDL